jgi:hypothetical protein
MHRFAVLLLAVVCASCGGSQFTGTYASDIHETFVCGTTSRTYTWPMTFTLNQNGASVGLEISGFNVCPVTGTVSDNTVTVVQHVCPADMDGTVTTWTGGTMTLASTVLTIEMEMNLQRTNGTTCTRSWTGQLVKQ